MNKAALLSSAAIGAGLASSLSPALATSCVPSSNASTKPTLTVESNMHTYCGIELSSYNNSCTGTSVQTSLVLSTGGTVGLCLQDFKEAMIDAGRYFYDGTQTSSGFWVSIPQGTWDFSSLSSTVTVINLPNSGSNSAAPPSGEQLVIDGAGSGSSGTKLITSNNQQTIQGDAVSHIVISDMAFGRNYAGIGQGNILSASELSEVYDSSNDSTLTPALTVAMQSPQSSSYFSGEPGFYNLTSGFTSGGQGNLSTFTGNYIHAYDNVLVNGVYTPTLDSTLFTGANSDSFIPFHNICNTAGGTVTTCLFTGTTPNAVTLTTGTLVFFLGPVPDQALGPNDQRAYEFYSTALSHGLSVMACAREAGSNQDFAEILDGSLYNTLTSSSEWGQDIEFNNLTLTEAARTVFKDVHNIQMNNVQILREPAVSVGGTLSQYPCLSTDSGGFQLQSPDAGTSYGHTLTNLTIVGTADVPLEFFDDSGGGTFANPASVVSTSTLTANFAGITVMTPSGTLSNVDVYPYVGYEYGGPPYTSQSPTLCPTSTGANCILNEWEICENSGTLVTYCPVQLVQGSSGG